MVSFYLRAFAVLNIFAISMEDEQYATIAGYRQENLSSWFCKISEVCFEKLTILLKASSSYLFFSVLSFLQDPCLQGSHPAFAIQNWSLLEYNTKIVCVNVGATEV